MGGCNYFSSVEMSWGWGGESGILGYPNLCVYVVHAVYDMIIIDHHDNPSKPRLV